MWEKSFFAACYFEKIPIYQEVVAEMDDSDNAYCVETPRRAFVITHC